MRLKQLIKDLNYIRVENFRDCQIKGVTCNSGNVLPGYLFVAIRGASADGHKFIDQAIEKGASAVLLEKDVRLEKVSPKILVSDSGAALAELCAAFFKYPAKRLKVIGITGTNGKTTISYLLESILKAAGLRCGVIGTVNYRLGHQVYPAMNTTPGADTLQSLLQELTLAKSKYAIMEVSSHALAQNRVAGIDFAGAIFTNLSKEHLDYHGNLNNYFSCKARLFEGLGQQKFAVINVDDPFGKRLVRRTRARVITYAIEHPAQVQAQDLVLNSKGCRFTIVAGQDKLELKTPLIGRHNIYNVLAAFSAAWAEEINFSDIIRGVVSLSGVPGRLEQVACGQNFSVFIDYAHTEDALKKVLLALKQVSGNRIGLVFGCGGDRDKLKRPKMGKVASELADLAIITNDNPRSEAPQKIVNDILRGISPKADNYKVVLDRFQAISQVLNWANKDDIVLLAGKGHEDLQIFADKILPFNDRRVAEEILQCLQSKR